MKDGALVAVPANALDHGRVAQHALDHAGHVDRERLLDQNNVMIRQGEAVHVARIQGPPDPESGQGLACVECAFF